MPYQIELMAIGEDIYPLLERAAAALNGVQNEFEFRLSTPVLRPEGIGFRRSAYSTAEIWKFLRQQRERLGGYRPYIIAFVTAPLRSDNFNNLFGSHEAEKGLAVVTTCNAAQYVREITRYCCYYLVRYTLSFVNPQIKAHEDERTKDCYFHFKRHKPEIQHSMNAGRICDACRARLDNPLESDDGAHRLSAAEHQAIEKMLAYVSGELPYAIIMKGGGVKGLAFAGALIELENYYWFDRHVGTSAGALAAVLLAASYKPAELVTLLREKNFRDFMDAPRWRIFFNLLWSKGCFPGETCRLWIAELLSARLRRVGEVVMGDLDGALVYAARQGSGTLTFDSLGERRDTVASFAARCSMSIPFFFFPVTVDGRRVFDGGLRNNFPLTRFLSEHRRSNFIALYLGKRDNANSRGLIFSDIMNIVVEGEERQTVDAHADKVIIIDTSPVGTVDFNLSDLEKEFLLRVGKAAAIEFLHARKFDDGPSEEDVNSASRQAEACRKEVIQFRRRRRVKRMIVSLLVLMLAAIGYLLFRGGAAIIRDVVVAITSR